MQQIQNGEFTFIVINLARVIFSVVLNALNVCYLQLSGYLRGHHLCKDGLSLSRPRVIALA